MASSRTDLLLDHVEVVEQPLPRRRDRPVGADVGGEQRTCLSENSLVLGEARKQAVARRALAKAMRGGGEARPVMLHLLCAEELGTKRRLAGDRARPAWFTPKHADELDQ